MMSFSAVYVPPCFYNKHYSMGQIKSIYFSSLIGIDVDKQDISFKRKINDTNVTRRFDDFMSSM